jgi:hypothetical protein
MEDVILRLIGSAFGTDLNPKIISCLQAYRCAIALRCFCFRDVKKGSL